MVVNSEVLTQFGLTERVDRALRELRSRGTVPPDRNDLQRQVLERMILERAQMQLARETGLQVGGAQLMAAALVGATLAGDMLTRAAGFGIGMYKGDTATDPVSVRVEPDLDGLGRDVRRRTGRRGFH